MVGIMEWLEEGKLEEFVDTYYYRVHSFLYDQIDRLPRLMRFFGLKVLGRISCSEEIMTAVMTLSTQDRTVISNQINEKIGEQLIQASENIFPQFFAYLLPINIVFLIVIWFI